MFQLKKNGNDRSDCTAPYSVILDREYTVKEFVHAVLSDRREWGYIGIKNEKNPWFGEPKCEYRYGKLETILPNDVMNNKVISAKADGGWSRMDYIIEIERCSQKDGEADV